MELGPRSTARGFLLGEGNVMVSRLIPVDVAAGLLELLVDLHARKVPGRGCISGAAYPSSQGNLPAMSS
jgi:hypothetical protein